MLAWGAREGQRLLECVWSYAATGAWSATDPVYICVSSNHGFALMKHVTVLPRRLVTEVRRLVEARIAELTGATALTCELELQRKHSEELALQLARETERADSSQDAILTLCGKIAALQAENSRMATELAVLTAPSSPLWADLQAPVASPSCLGVIYEREPSPVVLPQWEDAGTGEDTTVHSSHPGGSTPDEPTRFSVTLGGGCSPFLPAHTPPQTTASRSGESGLSIYLSCLQTVTEGINGGCTASVDICPPVSVSDFSGPAGRRDELH